MTFRRARFSLTKERRVHPDAEGVRKRNRPTLPLVKMEKLPVCPVSRPVSILGLREVGLSAETQLHGCVSRANTR